MPVNLHTIFSMIPARRGPKSMLTPTRQVVLPQLKVSDGFPLFIYFIYFGGRLDS
jgi:hypothetical protein